MSLNDLLKSLQKEYLSELPPRIEGIREHLENKDIPSLVEDFHKLKGTGKTYGIPEISDLGEQMEQLLITCPAIGFSRVPHALEMLTEIHRLRVSGSVFEIGADMRFQQMKKAG